MIPTTLPAPRTAPDGIMGQCTLHGSLHTHAGSSRAEAAAWHHQAPDLLQDGCSVRAPFTRTEQKGLWA